MSDYDDDVVTVEINKGEASTITVALLLFQHSGACPPEAANDIKSFAGKMMAAIEAQKMTNWEEGVN